ncbi:hypothetical protein MATL_G00227090 [Megalops atlanticus]|uniref:Uncharacterized protein n=1 Tax=Megalops atlanticus TaxID=7932 RepID=A0A9D3PFL7_MEGAT|nr:hypothetical protein MATL_G00227090 [Megalops atlanticus]
MRMELEKRSPNILFVNATMDRTFSLHRKEIVEQEPPVNLVKYRWPALFMEYQVYCEFQRTTTVSLQSAFLSALETHTPKILRMFRFRRAYCGDEMQTLLDLLYKQ